jgi:hypothetical protein
MRRMPERILAAAVAASAAPSAYRAALVTARLRAGESSGAPISQWIMWSPVVMTGVHPAPPSVDASQSNW